ncbi:MAG: glycosyltransferase family 2 protein [Terriglobia bacterium]|nr:MAG: glycosyltransferase family 2 protein [Terriglobia bacterium]
MNRQLREKLRQLRQALDDSEIPVTNRQLKAALTLVEEIAATLDRQQERITRRQLAFDRRLLAIENSRFFRLLRLPGRFLLDWRGRLGQALWLSALHPLYVKIARPQRAADRYRLWLEQQEQPAVERPLFRQPLISIIMPVCNPKREWLEAAVESVRAQTYSCWQLCACDDASELSWVAEYFAGQASADPRIRFTRLDRRGGISAASNAASGMASGDYVAFLDQDDVLAPQALYCVAEAVEDGWPDLLYTDEDYLENGRRVQPIFKPGFSPDLLYGCMYMSHLLVVRRSKLIEAGGLRPAFDGSQDYDLALRVTSGTRAVRHIPRILYHWRKHAASTAETAAAKPFSHEAGQRALAEAIERRGAKAVVTDGPQLNSYRVHWPAPPDTQATLIICSRTPSLLKSCMEALQRKTAHPQRQFVVVRHEAGNLEAWKNLQLPCDPVWVPYRGPFNFARMNNHAAQKAAGSVLVFLNDDIEPLTSDWLTQLMGHVLRPEVGAAGAKLLYPSGAIQHAGMVTGISQGVGHLHRDTFASADWNWLPFTRNISAVTGACMAVRRDVFEELGGFDEAFPVNYNDVDFCLRAHRAGYEVVIEPNAVLRHAECATRMPGVSVEEQELWEERWQGWLAQPDPYYNPNLSSKHEAAVLDPQEAPGELSPRP